MAKNSKENIFKKFELNKSNLKGLFASFKIFVCILLVLLVILIFKSIFFRKSVVNYPIVYNKSGGGLVLLNKKEKKIELSKEDSVSDILYANNTDKYVLFMKNSSLYVYKANRKDKLEKVLGNVKKYYFSPDDKYVVSVDEDDNLYVYNYNKNEKIVSDIDGVKLLTDDYVIYQKDNILYKRSLKVKKDEVTKIEKRYGKDIKLLEKKYLIYIDAEKALKLYNINTEELVKIDEDVSVYYGDEDTLSFYYLTIDNTLYYYDGSKSNKVTNDIYDIANVDIVNNEVVYSKYDKTYTLYFQKGTKEPRIIEDELKKNINYVYINNNKAVYYVNKDNDLMFVRISGSKVGKNRTVMRDVEALSFKKTKSGYVFLADATKKGLGTLYLTNSYKAKKIDTDVIGTNIKINNDGTKFYYYKNYSGKSGSLYYSNGGKPRLIDDDITKYQYVSDKVLYYIKNYSSSKMYGDLYKYTNKPGKISDKVYNISVIHNEYEK